MMKTLSICVVAYNEEQYLPNLFNDLDAQLYPHSLIEVVLVDSMSTDTTKQLMIDYLNSNTSFLNIQVLDNPNRNQASGWNIAITNAKGDVISRIDAHSHLTPEFSKYVMEDIDSGEDIVGGIRPCIIENNTKWGITLLTAENSLFGSSINKSRHSEEKQYVKTVFHASYLKDVFQKAGLFNESLLRTEDNELHYRMRKAGYNIFYDPRIVSYQFSRNSLKKMLIQKFKNGYWIGRTLSIEPRCFSLYHFVPLLFVLAIITTGIVASLGISAPLILLWSIYGLANLIMSLVAVISTEDRNMAFFSLPCIFLILHLCYGMGTMIGLLSTIIILFRRKPE